MEYLKQLRAEKGVSQQIVADYLEITRQAYSNYENGNRDPDNEMLLKMAEYFGVSVDFLLRGQKEAPASESGRDVTDKDIMFALWGDTDEVDEDDLADVKRYAAFIRDRKKQK